MQRGGRVPAEAEVGGTRLQAEDGKDCQPPREAKSGGESVFPGREARPRLPIPWPWTSGPLDCESQFKPVLSRKSASGWVGPRGPGPSGPEADCERALEPHRSGWVAAYPEIPWGLRDKRRGLQPPRPRGFSLLGTASGLAAWGGSSEQALSRLLFALTE